MTAQLGTILSTMGLVVSALGFVRAPYGHNQRGEMRLGFGVGVGGSLLTIAFLVSGLGPGALAIAAGTTVVLGGTLYYLKRWNVQEKAPLMMILLGIAVLSINLTWILLSLHELHLFGL